MKALRNKRSEKGTAMVEFAFCMTLIVPLLLGTMVIGMNLVRAVQVTEVCRDAGHMYAYGIDMSQPAEQNMIVKMGPEIGMTVKGGNGVLLLSSITYVDDVACIAGGYPKGGGCPNFGQYVVTRRIVIGNNQLHKSNLASPSPGLIDSTTGAITPQSYVRDGTCVVPNFDQILTVPPGQFAYVSEMWASTPDLSWWDALGTTTVSSRSIF